MKLSKDERRIEALKAAITESRTWRMVSGENPERASVGPMKQSQEPQEEPLSSNDGPAR